MNYWYFWLTPPVVLAIILLFRFTGCQLFFEAVPGDVSTGPYGDKVLAEPGLISYWRLHDPKSEEPAAPVADNIPVPGGVAGDERQVNPGVYKAARIVTNGVPPDSADAPGQLVLLEPGLLDIDDGTVNASARVDGGFMEIPFSNSLALTSFSIETLVFPEWDPAERGIFRTVISFINVPFTSGFALYGGPDGIDPNNPDVWQVWLGDGAQPVRIDFNHGSPPLVDFTKTNYLAVTYDSTTQLLNLYTYVVGISLDSGPFNPVHDAPATFTPNNDPAFPFLIGIERNAPPVYPFKGRIQEVALYNRALVLTEIASHIGSGLNVA